MSTAAFIFPHQLFSKQPVLQASPDRVFLIEDSLFFGDQRYPARFHKQKLAFHRVSMANYARRLGRRSTPFEHVRRESAESALPGLCQRLADEGFENVVVGEMHDFLLDRRLREACRTSALTIDVVATPMFLNTAADNREWRASQKRWFMADFYQWQRRRFDILMDGGKPLGGRWSFDDENRRKLPQRDIPYLPALPLVRREPVVARQIDSIEQDFADNPGSLSQWIYPTSHASAERWLESFLVERFEHFGAYEDAVVEGQSWLYHGVLTPMLNVGLLTPRQVVDKALEAAEEYGTPINSVEGFVRQLIGWREFMRATYDDIGVPMRTTNHWQHRRALPQSFYDATTGIDPLDDILRRVLDTGYCHHIERLMLLGGFMFLCEIDPDEIYRWFMEMFIDSYDWVMVPNVYAMSQNADGGRITTKPYFSGSNYVMKMSNYKRGDWCETWDALFWRWIWNHRDILAGNPRWSMMCRNAERMDVARRKTLLARAERYLETLEA